MIPAPFDKRTAVRRFLRMTLFLIAGFMLISCGKKAEEETPPVRQDLSISSETGPLPEAGGGARLSVEQSTFLRRHAEDPVQWHPWGEEAFQKAAKENKPVLLSVGYTSCPWSARMQRESFQNPAVVRFMNRHFINVLIDREERPDISSGWLQYTIYKKMPPAWPVHVWLTPEGLPVYNGTYYPSRTEGGKASWSSTLEYVATQWANEQSYIVRQAEIAAKDYRRESRRLWKSSGDPLPADIAGRAYEKLRAGYDPANGGFTGIPKFPRPHLLSFLLNYAAASTQNRFGRRDEALEMVTTTLDRILRGGIVDQLDGGIFRYSTDLSWTVPQFEKMLYDQGFMADVLIRAGQVSGRADFTEAGRRMLRYAQTALGHLEGAFYCAEGSVPFPHAEDKQVSTGAAYTWKLEEIRRVTAPEALPLITAVYGLEEGGNVPYDSPGRINFNGLNLLAKKREVPAAAADLGLDAEKAETLFSGAQDRLLKARTERAYLLVDKKVLTGWNGLMISSLARAGRNLGDEALVQRAEKAVDFVLKNLRKPDGSLLHAWLDGPSSATACSEDYALLIQGLLDLYEATGDLKRLQTAVELQDRQIAVFWDGENGGFFDGPSEGMVMEPVKSLDEGTELAPGAVSAYNLGRLAAMLDRPDFTEKLQACRAAGSSVAGRNPSAFLRFIAACGLAELPPLQIVIAGKPDALDRSSMLKALRHPLPGPAVRLYVMDKPDESWLKEKNPLLTKLSPTAPDRTVIHVCRGFQILTTLTDPPQVEAWLQKKLTASR